jgi:predicted nicotinamide N-methyase
MEHMAYLATIPLRNPLDEAQEMHVHSYFPPEPLDVPELRPILIKEARNLLSKGNNVGLRTWEAALHLAWYLTLSRPDLVSDRNIIELGAGTGFLSLLCAGHLNAAHVLATDGLGHVCEAMQTNMDLNHDNKTLHGHAPPSVRQLDWLDTTELQEILQNAKESAISYDLVIGADITYHPDILHPLAEVIATLCDTYPNIAVLISATIRSSTFSQFVAICQDELGFTVTELPCRIPDGLRYSGFFHSVATEIKIVSLERRKAR